MLWAWYGEFKNKYIIILDLKLIFTCKGKQTKELYIILQVQIQIYEQGVIGDPKSV